MRLESTTFRDGGTIPALHTCDGQDRSPELRVSAVPPGTKSLVLIMDDPDAPGGTWDHWVVFNIPPQTATIPAGKEPPGTPGRNSWGRPGYGGPCPPDQEHRYFFTLYALDCQLPLKAGATKAAVRAALQGHVLDEAQLMGRYDRRR